MLRIISLIVLLIAACLLFACGSAPQSNSNMVLVNSSANNSANIPPEFSTSPIPPSANATVGIPANGVNTLPKGATPTPGIPDPKLANRPVKPGATPTPGIPDADTIRRQMQGLERPNVNAVNGLAPPGGGMMMKKKPQLVNKPQ